MKRILFLIVAFTHLALPAVEHDSFYSKQMAQEGLVLQVRQPKKIIFFGESYVGKTTLMQELCALSDTFYIPILTVTRSPRLDDEVGLFEYVSKEEYQKSQEKNEFFIDMGDGKTGYGYKKKHITNHGKHLLLYGSPFTIDLLKNIDSAFLVLIEADQECGFSKRQDPEELKTLRRELNYRLSKEFFCQEHFRKKIDLIFYNTFGDLSKSASFLFEILMENIKEN